jgi:acyl carrier protein
MAVEMTREELQSEILIIFSEEFEIENPGLDDDLNKKHDFDSIDAIGLLVAIEKMLGIKLSQNDKKRAMGIRTINQICSYVESIRKEYG